MATNKSTPSNIPDKLTSLAERCCKCSCHVGLKETGTTKRRHLDGKTEYTTEVVLPCDENERGAHDEKNVRCGHISGKIRRRRPNLRWKVAFKRVMTALGLKEGNTTNRAAWRKKINSYTGDVR